MTEIRQGHVLDRLQEMPQESIHCCVTSPPYWGLRDYGTAGWSGGLPECDHVYNHGAQGATGQRADRTFTAQAVYRAVCGKCGAVRIDQQIGLEATPEEYVAKMVEVFREVRRVLRPDATLWLNLGSSFFGGKNPNPSPSSLRAPACDNDGIEPQDSRGSDSACFDLCDGCRDAILRLRTENIGQPSACDASPPLKTDRDSGRLDYAPTIPADELPCAPASTSPEFSPLLPVACSHCANCEACLSVLRSSSRDARLCVRRSGDNFDTLKIPQLSDRHSRDKEPSSLAYLYSSIASRRWKSKDLVDIPHLVAQALQADGWYLRSDVIWAKPAPMPESVTDRPTRSHEHIFLLAKSERYFYDADAIAEPANGWNGSRFDDARDLALYPNIGRKPRNAYQASSKNGGSVRRTPLSAMIHGNLPGRDDGGAACNGPGQEFRNKRDVWTVNTDPFPEAHFATFPPALILPCILAGCPAGGTVLDPFAGAGTTMLVAKENGRNSIGIELNPEYIEIANRRLSQEVLDFDPQPSSIP